MAFGSSWSPSVLAMTLGICYTTLRSEGAFLATCIGERSGGRSADSIIGESLSDIAHVIVCAGMMNTRRSARLIYAPPTTDLIVCSHLSAFDMGPRPPLYHTQPPEHKTPQNQWRQGGNASGECYMLCRWSIMIELQMTEMNNGMRTNY